MKFKGRKASLLYELMSDMFTDRTFFKEILYLSLPVSIIFLPSRASNSRFSEAPFPCFGVSVFEFFN